MGFVCLDQPPLAEDRVERRAGFRGEWYLKAGILPKNATKTRKEMPNMTLAIVPMVPISVCFVRDGGAGLIVYCPINDGRDGPSRYDNWNGETRIWSPR